MSKRRKLKLRIIPSPQEIWGNLGLTAFPWHYLFNGSLYARQKDAGTLRYRGAHLSAFTHIISQLAAHPTGFYEMSEQKISERIGYCLRSTKEALIDLIANNHLWVTGEPPAVRRYMLGAGTRKYHPVESINKALIRAIISFDQLYFCVPSSALSSIDKLGGMPLELYFTIVRIMYERASKNDVAGMIDVDVAELKRRLIYPGSKGKLADAFAAIDHLVDAEVCGGGRRYRIWLLNPISGDRMEDVLKEIKFVRQMKHDKWKPNTPEEARDIEARLRVYFGMAITGTRGDGQLTCICPWCGKDAGLLQPAKGLAGAFFCNSCRKGGAASSVIAEMKNIDKDMVRKAFLGKEDSDAVNNNSSSTVQI